MPRSYDELRIRLETDRDRLTQEIQELGSPEQERPGYGNHMADDATGVFEQTWNLSLRQSLDDTLRDVKAALARFEDNSYGSCTVCGSTIEWGRLKTIPYTALCVHCAGLRDRKG